MAFGRFVGCILLVVSPVFSIEQALAQSAPAAAQIAGQVARNDAAGNTANSGAFDNSAAKETAAPPESLVAATPKSVAEQMRISGGDLLNVSVYGVPELTQDIRVNNTGDVYLPLIAYVQLGGLTLDQAQTVIENRLREGGFVKNPHVTIFLKDFVNQSATVTGEVNHPGIYPILGTRRLLEVLAAAGGPTQRAGKTVTITHRDHPDEPAKVDLPADLAKAPQDNIEVFPGDTILVNRAGLVYVVGEVQRPSGLVMDNNEKMTVMEAIALVGGPTAIAATNSARLIRTTSTGREELHLALNKMLSTKRPDVDLQPDDIIFVPASLGKKAAKRSVDSVVAVTQGLAIYHP